MTNVHRKSERPFANSIDEPFLFIQYCIIDFIDGRNANGTKTMLSDSPQD